MSMLPRSKKQLREQSDLEESKPDVEDEGPSPSCKRRKTSAVKNNNMSGCNSSELPFSKEPSTLSNEALEEIHIFSDEVKVKANQLGQQFGRSAHDILVVAGFGIKPSHTKINKANLFCSWYWAMQPKPEGATRNEFNNIITKEYNDLMKDVPKDDMTARRDKLKHSIAAKLENVKVQFSGLAEAWCNLEEIEIVGVLMYVGEDPAGRQLSGIFGGSDMIRKFINDCGIDVHGLMDKYTSIFQCLRNGDSETPPGPGFDFKKLKAGTLCKLVVPYLHRKLGHMYDGQSDDEEAEDLLVDVPEIEIKLWHEGMFCSHCVLFAHMLSNIIRIPYMSPTKGDVALIRASDGTVLRKVADDPEWQKICEEGDHRRKESAAARPKKHVPCKRPHTETTSNNQGELGGAPLPGLPMVLHDQLSPVLPVCPSLNLPIHIPSTAQGTSLSFISDALNENFKLTVQSDCSWLAWKVLHACAE
ncbi:hypothetical protein SCLCIDRAFT_23409 [Scleroderma citrinum Foug A]|uniref:Uncharacterized protein n=1 Tax=Scleroderma citrinum Foug A TaxID=1036808 RepID=A0A0C3DUU3_9AGAM|nr:hypothetical protein SCLCIDRAFT_23409 [Scleroderma citrinum Foug A]